MTIYYCIKSEFVRSYNIHLFQDEEGMDTDDQAEELEVPTKCIAKEIVVDIK